MFYNLIYRSPLWAKAKDRNIRIFVLGTILYIVFFLYLQSKYNKLQNYKKYIYYIFVTDFLVMSLYMSYSEYFKTKDKKVNKMKTKTKKKKETKSKNNGPSLPNQNRRPMSNKPVAPPNQNKGSNSSLPSPSTPQNKGSNPPISNNGPNRDTHLSDNNSNVALPIYNNTNQTQQKVPSKTVNKVVTESEIPVYRPNEGNQVVATN
ncbi:MAG: hypothetical protein Barrevirus8_13 [Barrevirus sp.]|uniref:Uncharacterized protein n=1 Tax=Barrevirus sp. TaxID=2487763 RepID=A0A3G4ZQ70_9VIRU|nr:MAG: hypothetical protein Barrevirus8_13 [Barrevirus sp.]